MGNSLGSTHCKAAQDMWVSRSITPFILNLNTNGGQSPASCPMHLTPGTEPLSKQEATWSTEIFLRREKSFVPARK